VEKQNTHCQAVNADGNKNLIQALVNSKLYQDYQRAFAQATGLPLCLQTADSWQLPNHGHPNQSPFCELMSRKSRSCAACLQVQQKLIQSAREAPQTVVCFAGMVDTAVPVQLGEHLIGFLQTGQVFRHPPSPKQFERLWRLIQSWGITVDKAELQKAYFQTRVLSAKQYESIVRLLHIFAQHLSMVSNQVLMQQQNAEPPPIRRARQFIAEHYNERLSLSRVAQVANTSSYYFCKMFKKATGLNFTHYVARVRIERAKNLLLNPNLRVSEIAFEVGFQSLTHFNRVFKKIIGRCPTAYRTKVIRSIVG